MAEDNRNASLRVLRLTKPELRFQQSDGACDPRLVELVRLLARRAAWDWYEKQAKERGGTGF